MPQPPCNANMEDFHDVADYDCLVRWIAYMLREFNLVGISYLNIIDYRFGGICSYPRPPLMVAYSYTTR
jgi:hypothetical protein